MRRATWAGVLFLALVGSFVLSIWLGSVALSPSEVIAALSGRGDPTNRLIVVQIRAPRAVLAILVGGGLALAGAVFQALLRNPLAEPYILGISGGAATGAVLALALGLVASHSWALPAASFAGAILAVVLGHSYAAIDSGLCSPVSLWERSLPPVSRSSCRSPMPGRCVALSYG